MFFPKRADDASTVVNLPQPRTVSPSQVFEGNDGQWSTFKINIGDVENNGQGQNFNVLISTSSPVTLVPIPMPGCDGDCAKRRGAGIFHSQQSRGYNSSESVGWNQRGNHGISMPDWWTEEFGATNGTWGVDTVGLGPSSPDSWVVPEQWVVKYPYNDDFYMGTFGLAAGPIDPGGGARDPFLTSFSAEIPSVSFAYSAGARYQNGGKGAVGSLVLGGFDRSRMKSDGLSITMPSKQNTDLVVGVSGISYKSNPDIEASEFSLTKSTFLATIDSSVPYFFLPGDICDQFAEKFRLTYDEGRNIYTVNASSHSFNTQQKASVSLTVVKSASEAGSWTTIDLPYSAFDLQASAPIFENTTNYFPLKRQKGDTSVLGRAFLQEAYLIVDYERGNFTVAPAQYPDSTTKEQLVPIYNLTFVPSQPPDLPASGGGGLSPGAVAGIVVGIVVAFLAAGLGAFFFWKKRRAAKHKQEDKTSEIDTIVAGTEVKHRRVSELDSQPPGSQKPSTLAGGYYDGDQKDLSPFPPISEMDSPPAELYSPPAESPALSSVTPGDSGGGIDYFVAGHKVRRRGATRESLGNNTPGTPGIAELPGDDGQFQVGGQHFEPVQSPGASPRTSPILYARGLSDSSFNTNIAEAFATPDEGISNTDKAGNREAAMEEGASDPLPTLERRPSHARGLSDTTVQSDTTAVSQPTPEELESWALGDRGDQSRRPISE